MKIRQIMTAILILGSVPVYGGDTFTSGENSFDIEFVTVGDPENAPNTIGSIGSVPYIYRIGKFEISRDMVEMANAEGNLELTLSNMSFVANGLSGDMPATGVNWNEAARFVNWLNENQGFPPAYKFDKSPGEAGYDVNATIDLWQEGDSGFDANNRFRNSLAHYFLPSSDEWHKAAYYDPNANGGTGGYWRYPTGSDTAPVPVGNGTEDATAVFSQPLEQGPAEVFQAGGPSPYGAIGMGGNADEWEESTFDQRNDSGSSPRGVVGGNWHNGPELMAGAVRFEVSLDFPFSINDLGFRIASKATSSLIGDFNEDGELTVNDVDLLINEIQSGTHIVTYDLNADLAVDNQDLRGWVQNIKKTWFGDANLDGEFNSSDFISVFQLGKYETNSPATWSQGDWNADDVFDSTDFIAAFQDGGYELGPRTPASLVPEPSSHVFLTIGLLILIPRKLVDF